MRTEDYIADNIIALCKKRDMSKYRLSQLTGISQSSIGKIIAKESLPTMPTVEKICDALGVTMAQFFAGMDVPVSLQTILKNRILGNKIFKFFFYIHTYKISCSPKRLITAAS